MWFLAVDPDGKHDTGDAVPWTNKLTLTHQPKVLPGKRLVELTVKPRGAIRWNTTGANPKDGQVYSGPIELTGDAEVTIYAHAEDKGVSATRTFVIPKPTQKGPTVDKTKPATLRRKLDFRGNAEAFAAINAVKALQVRIGGVSIDIGEGTRNVSARFGSDSVITAEHLDQFIATAREAIEEPTAEVKLSFRELKFNSGHDLEAFLAKLGIEIGAGEVEQ